MIENPFYSRKFRGEEHDLAGIWRFDLEEGGSIAVAPPSVGLLPPARPCDQDLLARLRVVRH